MNYLKYFKHRYKLNFVYDNKYTSMNRDNINICSNRYMNYNRMKYIMVPIILNQKIP